MKLPLSAILAATLLPMLTAVAEDANPVVVIKTSAGTIKAELFKDKAPITVVNFLKYTEKKHYDGTVFHRVMKDFMNQGGGIVKKEDGSLEERPSMAPIKNESDNGLKNDKGTLAMARKPDPDSATCQFFINAANNNKLDRGANPKAPEGYCVFGKVTEGMDVVEKIQNVATGIREIKMLLPDGSVRARPNENVPVEDVVIESVTVQKAGPGAAPAKEGAKPAADPKAAADPKPADKSQ